MSEGWTCTWNRKASNRLKLHGDTFCCTRCHSDKATWASCSRCMGRSKRWFPTPQLFFRVSLVVLTGILNCPFLRLSIIFLPVGEEPRTMETQSPGITFWRSDVIWWWWVAWAEAIFQHQARGHSRAQVLRTSHNTKGQHYSAQKMLHYQRKVRLPKAGAMIAKPGMKRWIGLVLTANLR